MKPVTVSLQDLQTDNISHSTLLDAFGPTSLGILIVRDLPPSFPSLRAKVLTSASHLASLPAHNLEKLTKPDAKYLVGWSHGKETLRPGVVDTLKGSYYINCSFYNTTNPRRTAEQEAQTWPGFEEYTAPSIWPDTKDIPDFQEDAEALIRLIIDTAVLVARQCDRFAEKEIEHYESSYLERMVKSSRTTKGRLLHYFPSDNKSTTSKSVSASMPTQQNSKTDSSNTSNGTNGTKDDDLDTWCTTHLDHGCLTGLTSAQYIDESQPSPIELPSSPSPTAGLYIRDRSGSTHKVAIPRDCLAFQTGEALELITQGKFKAVPHFVRGVDAAKEEGLGRVARNTLAVFTQPNLGEVVDTRTGLTFGEFARGVVKKNTAG